MSRNHVLRADVATVHRGNFDARIKPVLTIEPGDTVDLTSLSANDENLPPPGSPFKVLPEHARVLKDVPRGLGAHFMTGPIEVAGRSFERVARSDPDYLPEVMAPLLECYEATGDVPGARSFLAEMCEHYRGIAPVLALTRMIEREDGVAAARAYLAKELKDRPSVRGEAALIELSLAEQADSTATLVDLKHITDQLLVRNPSYRCTRCGFGARSHHWQCPSCKEWGSVKPLLNYAVV